MSALAEKIGALAGKLASYEGVISGMLSTLDARVVGDAVNRNGNFMGQVIRDLDPRVLAEAINNNPTFMTILLRELDPALVASALNKNTGFMTSLIAALHPNVFTDSAGVLISKMKNNIFPVTKGAEH